MPSENSSPSNTKRVRIIFGAMVLIIAMAILAVIRPDLSEDATAPKQSEVANEQPAKQVETQTDAAQTAAPQNDEKPDVNADAAVTETAKSETSPMKPAAKPNVDAPAGIVIDILRVDATGEAMIAGRAEPNVMLRALLDGTQIATEQSDGVGQFAMFLSLSTSDNPRWLQIQQKINGQWAQETADAMIAPSPKQAQQTQLAELSAAPSDTNAASENSADAEKGAATVSTAQTQVEDSGKSDEKPQDNTAAMAEGASAEVKQPAPKDMDVINKAEAQPIIVSDDKGVRVIAQTQSASNVEYGINFDAISYDSAGQAVVQGHASGGVNVRIYIANHFKAAGQVQSDGKWQIVLNGLQAGIYRMRADLTDENGKVLARAETPFKREDPAALTQSAENKSQPDGAAAEAEKSSPITQVIVQPGSTLWAISRARYGKGMMYVEVFEANKNQIRDPDLIYPGQIFKLPEIKAE